MGEFDFLSKKESGDEKETEKGMSRCRYFWCSKCNTVYSKEEQLPNWLPTLKTMGENPIMMISGTRTCKCGEVLQVSDIYNGVHDLPRQYWDQVQPPLEVEG